MIFGIKSDAYLSVNELSESMCLLSDGSSDPYKRQDKWIES